MTCRKLVHWTDANPQFDETLVDGARVKMPDMLWRKLKAETSVRVPRKK